MLTNIWHKSKEEEKEKEEEEEEEEKEEKEKEEKEEEKEEEGTDSQVKCCIALIPSSSLPLQSSDCKAGEETGSSCTYCW